MPVERENNKFIVEKYEFENRADKSIYFPLFITRKYINHQAKSKNITFAVHPGHHSYGNRFIILV